MSEPKQSYPLSWPAGWKRTHNPGRSRFGTYSNKPSVSKALNLLLPELRRMGAVDIIISTNIRTRNDGLPYSNQSRPADTGAAVYFTYKKQETVIACDAFNEVGCNLYAVGMTVGALRGIDRWGCSELMNKAFTGFKALPENASPSTWQTILNLSENATEADIKRAHRELSRKYHPDTGSETDTEKFVQVQRAYQDAMSQFISA